MKKLILSLLLWTGLISTGHAGEDSVDIHIANTIFVFFKTMPGNDVNANDYQQADFLYKGMQVKGFKSKISNWVGFYKKISQEDLPAGALSMIKKNYSIENAIMYFNNAGEIYYFAEVFKDKKNLILKIDASGNIKVFNCTHRMK